MHENLESFKHGLIYSKIWLCHEIEHVIATQQINNPIIHILGSWHNTLGFMLLVRRSTHYGAIHGYDIDPDAIEVANKICDTWQHDYPKVYNHVMDVNNVSFSSAGEESVFINCSVNHIEGTAWFDSIPIGRIVCIQAMDVDDTNPLWDVKQPTKDINELLNKYNLNTVLYTGSREIKYSTLNYNRLMIIGIK